MSKNKIKMKKFNFFGLLLTLVLAVGCGTKKNSATTGDNSMNALDWEGVYIMEQQNDLPEIQLTLKSNNTYQIIVSNWNKQPDNTYFEGKFTWDKTGGFIQMDQLISNINTSKLKVGENVLWAKDGSTENIKFIKMDVNPALTEKYWKLVAVNDIKITNKDFIETEPHIMFKSEFNHVRGNDGCNQFQGGFEINGNKITFGRMLSTLKACPDVFASTEFRKLLSEEITFEVKNDKLTLKTKNDTFQFEAVYF